jgi:hypothetical protein
MGVQHGGAKKIVNQAGSPQGKSVQEQVNMLFEARKKYVAGVDMPARTRNSLANRYATEQRDVLAMAPGGDPSATVAAAPGAPGAPEGGVKGGTDIVSLGKELQGQGVRVSENPAFGGVNPVHKGKGHYEGRAIDVNAGFGIVEANHPEWGPKFDQIAASARQKGYTVIWRSAGHFNHMHIESKSASGQAPGGDITTGEPVAIAADSKSPQMQAGKTLSSASMQNAARTSLNQGPVTYNNDRFVKTTETIFQTSSVSLRKMEQAFGGSLF